MFKKVLLVLLVISIFAFSGIVTAEDDGLILVGSGTEAPKYQAAKEIFEEKYDVPVELVVQGYNQVHEKIVAAASSGKSPYDMVAVDNIYVPNYAVSKLIVPLTDFKSEDYFDQFTEASQAMMSYQGVPYALEGGNNYKFFMYNEAYLKEAGYSNPPETWDELIEMSKTMQEKDIVDYGIAFGWTKAEGLICDFTLFLNAFGGTYKNDAGEMDVNSAGSQRALQFMYDMLEKHEVADPASTGLTDREVQSLFNSGDVAFVLNWDFGYSWATDTERSEVVDDVKLALIPGTDYVESTTTGGGSGTGIVATSDKRELAWKYLEILNSKELQLKSYKEFGEFPTRKEVANDQIMDEYPASVKAEQATYSYPRAKIPWYPQFSNVLQTEVSRALTGGKSVEEALSDAQEEVEKLSERFDR